MGGDAQKINPLNPVDLVIDHSVMIDEFGNPRAFQMNVDREYERNIERYTFLKWGQKAFNNFRVVPPGTGICHQVNLEYLAQTVWSDTDQNGETVAYPDTLVGTDSHTTMVNGAAVLGWGVGGIEAEAAMLGQPISMLIPEVVGFKLTGAMTEGTTATDLVLKVVQMLRKKGVVGKFVEFYGDGLDHLPLADRATIGNMAPGIRRHLRLLPDRRRDAALPAPDRPRRGPLALVEAYAKANGMWREPGYEPVYTDTLELDMATVVPAISGPKRPQDHIALDAAARAFGDYVKGAARRQGRHRAGRGALGGGGRPARAGRDPRRRGPPRARLRQDRRRPLPDPRRLDRDRLDHLLHQHLEPLRDDRRGPRGAEGARARPDRKPWVKTSLAPGSQVVSAYLEAAGLQEDLDAIGFNLVGYGCTTCIGNSGPLEPEICEGDQRQRPDRRLASCRATATSRAGSAPTCAPTTSPRRRWWWPMRWSAT